MAGELKRPAVLSAVFEIKLKMLLCKIIPLTERTKQELPNLYWKNILY